MTIILYILLVLSFPLGVLTRFSITPSIGIYLQDVFIFLILIASLKCILAYFKNRKNSLFYAFVVFFIVSLLGILTHVDNINEFLVSFLYLVRLYAYILVVIPLINLSSKNLSLLKKVMIFSGFLYVFLGYIQYIYYPNLRNLYYLGWDEHLYRLFGTLLDPNFTGTYILLVLILFLSVVFEKFRKVGLWEKAVYLFGVLFLSCAILLTYSRSVFLVSVVSISLYLVLTGYKKLLIVFVSMFLLGLFFLPQNLGGEGVNLFRVASILARFEANMQGVLIFIQNPLIGVGFNTLRFVQVDYGFVSDKNVLTSHAAAGFPNSYIVLLSTTGLIGISVTLFILYKTLLGIMKLRSLKRHKAFIDCVFVSFVAVLLNSMFENTLFYSQILIWVMLLLGIAVCYWKREETKESTLP